MALKIGASNIQSAAHRVDVLSNNISNVNTIGFKGSSFETVLGAAMNGDSGGKELGLRQPFSQGSTTSTTNALDVAIKGSGLFALQDSHGRVSYTRNGQFSLDKDGYVVNQLGQKLLGYKADANGQILSGSPEPLNIDSSDSKPTETTKAAMRVTLDSRSPAVSGYIPFSSTDASTYTHSTTTTVYDSLGTSHNVQSFFIKRQGDIDPNYPDQPAPVFWEVHASVDGVEQRQRIPIEFDSTGKLTTDNGASSGFSVLVNNGIESKEVYFDLSETVSYASSFTVTDMSQDGGGIGQMVGYSVGGDGVITGQYANNKQLIMGQIVLAKFSNMDGLAPTDNNEWVETWASGVAKIGTPQSSGLGGLQSMATEDSNVDLTLEMVKLIAAQRAFQSAAEVVKRQDELLQGVIHMGN